MGSRYQFHILTSGLLLIQAFGGVQKVFINVFLQLHLVKLSVVSILPFQMIHESEWE